MLRSHYLHKLQEAGADEAGRGCLAGPVTAAAVILTENTVIDLLNDSKKLSIKNRNALKPIIENKALSYAVVHLEPAIIDEVNILNASIKAMQECILKLDPKPLSIIIDGNSPFLPKTGIKNCGGLLFTEDEIDFLTNTPSTCIIKGDATYQSIAAASILAKTHRDAYMEKIHEEFPMYNWNKNKGYPTKDHREAIRRYGITRYHRMSFRLLPEQLQLPL